MKKFVVGVDFGGTNIKLGLLSISAKLVARTSFSTKTYSRDKNFLIDALVQHILQLLRENKVSGQDVLGIGIGLPGLIDPQKGVVNFLPNVPGWKNIPLKKILERRLHLPVYLDNDAKVITLGEWKLGAGKGFNNLICLTLGTGVGSGLVIDGKLYRGEGNTAGELGHVPLNEIGPACNCGGVACLERSIGNHYLSQKAKTIFKKDLAPRDVGDLARRNDPRALKFWQETATHLANGLVSVVNLLNPRCIIIGGGVSNNLNFMKESLRQVIDRRALKIPAKMVRIVRAKLGDDAGLWGAFVLVRDAVHYA